MYHIDAKFKQMQMGSLKNRFHIFALASLLFWGIFLRGPFYLSQVWVNAGSLSLNRSLSLGDDDLASQVAANSEESFRRAGALFEGNNSAWRGLGFVLLAQGEELEALSTWGEGQAMEEELLDWGEQARRNEDYEEALVWYSRSITRNPDLGGPWFGVGRTFVAQGDQEAAIDAFLKALQRMPDNRDVWYELGLAYFSLQKWDKALESFENGLLASDGQVGKSYLYHQIGLLWQHSIFPHDLDKAWQAYTNALLVNDFHNRWQKAETLYKRGLILFWQKQWREAILEYEQALTANPNHYWTHIAMARAYWELGLKGEAYEFVRQATLLRPDVKNAYKVMALFYDREGRQEDAHKMYSRVLEIDSTDESALTWIGQH